MSEEQNEKMENEATENAQPQQTSPPPNSVCPKCGAVQLGKANTCFECGTTIIARRYVPQYAGYNYPTHPQTQSPFQYTPPINANSGAPSSDQEIVVAELAVKSAIEVDENEEIDHSNAMTISDTISLEKENPTQSKSESTSELNEPSRTGSPFQSQPNQSQPSHNVGSPFQQEREPIEPPNQLAKNSQSTDSAPVEPSVTADSSATQNQNPYEQGYVSNIGADAYFNPVWRPDMEKFAARGGAYGAVMIGVLSLIGSLITPLAIVNAIFGFILALWGLSSKKKKVAMLGMVLCLIACFTSAFLGVFDLMDLIPSRDAA